MNFNDALMEKWNALLERTEPAREKAKVIWDVVSEKLSFFWNYMMKFKKLFLCIPVAVFAIILAIRNLISLPAHAGIALNEYGGFAFEMVRELAVFAPLLVTGLCLLFVFMSKRILTPWLVSVFSLILPLWILFINTFPA